MSNAVASVLGFPCNLRDGIRSVLRVSCVADHLQLQSECQILKGTGR